MSLQSRDDNCNCPQASLSPITQMNMGIEGLFIPSRMEQRQIKILEIKYNFNEIPANYDSRIVWKFCCATKMKRSKVPLPISVLFFASKGTLVI